MTTISASSSNPNKINVIILAAGYGTRLTREIKDLESTDPEKFKKYQKLLNLPKALLPIKNKPLLTYWVETLLELHSRKSSNFEIHKLIIVTNDKFYKQFTSWWSELCCIESTATCKSGQDLNDIFSKSHIKQLMKKVDEKGDSSLNKIEAKKYLDKLMDIDIINDGTDCNDNRLGCNGSIRFAINQGGLYRKLKVNEEINKQILVIASDLLFYRPYNLSTFFDDTIQIKTNKVYAYKIPDSKANKHGIIEIDQKTKTITKFLEKPDINETTSRLACPCFYLFSENIIEKLLEFTRDSKNCPDASGHFIKWLVEEKHVLDIEVEEIDGRYDIGNFQSYLDCDQNY